MSDQLYKILGAPSSSSDEELRSIYRQLVRSAHPDVCGGTPENIRRFLEIQDAYDKIVEIRRNKSAAKAPGHRSSRPSQTPAYAKPAPRTSAPKPESDDFVEEMFDTLCKDLGSLASSVKSIFKFR